MYLSLDKDRVQHNSILTELYRKIKRGKMTFFDTMSSLRESISTQQRAVPDIAEALYLIKEHKLYLEGEYVSFKAFCAEPDLSLSYSYANKLCRLWKTYVVELKLPKSIFNEVPLSKLELMIPVLNDEPWEEWKDRCETLTHTDLKSEVQEKLGVTPKEATNKLSKKQLSEKLSEVMKEYLKGSEEAFDMCLKKSMELINSL